MPYLWLKALHVAAAITFVAGVLASALLLQLPPSGEAWSRDRLSVVHGLRTWHNRVTTPAMLTVWALGLALALEGGWYGHRWLQAKLVLVLALSAVHGVHSGALRRLAGGSPLLPRGLRPGGLLIVGLAAAIAVLAVTKPM
jgi:uncharacterized membrane protein